MPPAKLGLVYSHTGIRKFIDAIGAPRTRELFLVGGRIDAATALELGPGQRRRTRPTPSTEAALALAAEIAGNAPLAQRGNKRVIRAVLDAEGALDPDVERELVELRRACFSSEDFREGVRAFAEKRAPRVAGSLRPGQPRQPRQPPRRLGDDRLGLAERETHQTAQRSPAPP